MTFFAHSENPVGRWHPLHEHLVAVAQLTVKHAGTAKWAEEARLAGLLHDLGKYGDAFQRRLQGKESGLDHWSAGAWLALKLRCAAAALAVQGHHIGLQHLDLTALGQLDPKRLAERHPLGLRLTAASLDDLESRLRADGLSPLEAAQPMLGASLDCIQHVGCSLPVFSLGGCGLSRYRSALPR